MQRNFKMDFLLDFLSNKFFLTAMASWTVAQVLKVFIYAIINKTWDLSGFSVTEECPADIPQPFPPLQRFARSHTDLTLLSLQ